MIYRHNKGTVYRGIYHANLFITVIKQVKFKTIVCRILKSYWFPTLNYEIVFVVNIMYQDLVLLSYLFSFFTLTNDQMIKWRNILRITPTYYKDKGHKVTGLIGQKWRFIKFETYDIFLDTMKFSFPKKNHLKLNGDSLSCPHVSY